MGETDRTSVSDYRNCFACGQANARGLRLKIENENGRAAATFVPDASLEGYDGVLHGGVVSTVLDEVMVWAARFTTGLYAVTGELLVRFAKPIETGKSYRVEGWVRENRGRIVLAEASLKDGEGKVRARAEGKLFSVKEGKGL
jgi:uncharacterized protein (TIGR00369 family)